ncbi:hypothetical protein ACFQO1_08060 [Jejudonia soesokkakensis]|uniref:Lipoprotein n=1 Tax=Jejudonia soesokkakensis TaxID=1323432 RepID=A0ABW2MUQ0_9FLAO
MKFKILSILLLSFTIISCNEQGKSDVVKEKRTDLLDKTTSANIVLWMQKKRDAMKLYDNNAVEDDNSLLTNRKCKVLLGRIHKVDVSDIDLLDYKIENGVQEWTYRIIVFRGDRTEIFVGKVAYDKGLKMGETIVDWVKTSQLDV